MSKFIFLAGFLSAVVTLPALSGEQIDKSLNADGIKKVYVENLRGKVEIIGWEKEQVSVNGELDEKAKGLLFERDGKVIHVRVNVEENAYKGKNSDGSALKIKLPKEVRVEFSGVSSDFVLAHLTKGVEGKTVSGDIEFSDSEGHLEVATVSGDIISRRLSGKVVLSTVSGDIDDKSSNGRLSIKAVSGEIKTESQADNVDLGVVSGDLDFTLARVNKIELSNVSGEINGELSLVESARMKMSSVSGDINVKFNDDINASFRLKAHAGGDIINKLTKDKPESTKYSPRVKLNFETGNGSATVKATTVSGNIRLSK